MIIAPITRELKPIKRRVAVHETKPLKSVRPIMPQPVPLTEIKLTYQRPARETEMIKALIRDQPVAEAIEALTDHAWLVVLGHFAQAQGLTALLYFNSIIFFSFVLTCSTGNSVIHSCL